MATHIDVCLGRHRRLPIAIGDSVVRRVDRVDPSSMISHPDGSEPATTVRFLTRKISVARAIGLGVTIVVISVVTTSAGLHREWVAYTLVAAAVIGIGAVVALTRGNRPFLKAAVVSFLTVLCIQLLAYAELVERPASAQPPVMPPHLTMVLGIVWLSLMIGAMGGAVALGLRSLRAPHGAAR